MFAKSHGVSCDVIMSYEPHMKKVEIMYFLVKDCPLSVLDFLKIKAEAGISVVLSMFESWIMLSIGSNCGSSGGHVFPTHPPLIFSKKAEMTEGERRWLGK